MTSEEIDVLKVKGMLSDSSTPAQAQHSPNTVWNVTNERGATMHVYADNSAEAIALADRDGFGPISKAVMSINDEQFKLWLQEMAYCAQQDGMHPDQINAVCDRCNQ